MLSRNQQKLIRSLHQKKQREKLGLFLIEGNTIITDLVQSKQIHAENLELLAATPEWLNRRIVNDPGIKKRTVSVDPAELKKLSGLVSPPEVIAVLRMPWEPGMHRTEKSEFLPERPEFTPERPEGSELSQDGVESSGERPGSSEVRPKRPEGSVISRNRVESSEERPVTSEERPVRSALPFRPEQLREGITLVFESIRDPGNLGTIIRTADWFGISNIICSPDSVDTYNNKVVQASMGAVLRTRPIYIELTELFEEAGRFKIPVYAATMDGADFYDTPLKVPGLIVFGNESHGISAHLESYFRQKIRIPDFPAGTSGSESLNVASSVAVVCGEIRRRQR